jgi:hypothetical protein
MKAMRIDLFIVVHPDYPRRILRLRVADSALPSARAPRISTRI